MSIRERASHFNDTLGSFAEQHYGKILTVSGVAFAGAGILGLKRANKEIAQAKEEGRDVTLQMRAKQAVAGLTAVFGTALAVNSVTEQLSGTSMIDRIGNNPPTPPRGMSL